LIIRGQYTKRQKAEQQRLMDEESLRKQMNAKRAKEQAEKLHKVFVLYMYKEVMFLPVFVCLCVCVCTR